MAECLTAFVRGIEGDEVAQDDHEERAMAGALIVAGAIESLRRLAGV